MTNLKFAALGLGHKHIYGMAAGMVEVGGEFSGYWTEGEPQPHSGFIKRFPDVPRFDEQQSILENQEISIVLIAAALADRGKLSILAMSHGKDVMVDKPGCLTKAELADIIDCATQTGRIWSISFSERFKVPATTKADELIAAGAIGEVVQTVSLAPHRLNAATQPNWFWRPEQVDVILSDIGVHQVDQFSHFTGEEDAEIVHSLVRNFKNSKHCDFQDFGEINLLSGSKQGYARLDWYTPDAAPMAFVRGL
jgi:predicted dehydrogenase